MAKFHELVYELFPHLPYSTDLASTKNWLDEKQLALGIMLLLTRTLISKDLSSRLRDTKAR